MKSHVSMRKNEGAGIPPLLVPQLIPLPDHEAVERLKPVLTMLRSGLKDVQAEACQVLCLLSPQEDTHAALVDSGCVHALVECLAGNCSSSNNTVSDSSSGESDLRRAVDQHGILAVAALSDFMLTQEALLASAASTKLLTRLMDLSVDGPHDTAEMRREGARTFKNLCKRHSKQIRESLDMDGTQSQAISDWAASLDKLHDGRLKMQATEAAKSLSAAAVASF